MLFLPHSGQVLKMMSIGLIDTIRFNFKFKKGENVPIRVFWVEDVCSSEHLSLSFWDQVGEVNLNGHLIVTAKVSHLKLGDSSYDLNWSY